MNIKKQSSFLLLLLFFVACNDYEKIMGPALKAKIEDKNSNPIFDGEIEPAMPDPKENDKTLLGIDTNNNGIRDDIDIWINRTGKTYNERMSLRQLARAFREEWIAGNRHYENLLQGPIDTLDPVKGDYNRSNGRAIKKAASLEADATMGCLFFIFVEPRYTSKEVYVMKDSLRTLYKNTELRRKVQDAFYDFPHSYEVSEDKNLHPYDYCLFKIENLEQAKIDLEKSHAINRQKSGFKYDKK